MNPHSHTVFLDGVFTLERDGRPRFHPLARVSDRDVADAVYWSRVDDVFSD